MATPINVLLVERFYLHLGEAFSLKRTCLWSTINGKAGWTPGMHQRCQQGIKPAMNYCLCEKGGNVPLAPHSYTPGNDLRTGEIMF